MRKRAWGKNKIVLCPREFQNASFVYSPLTMVNFFRGKVFVAYFETIEARCQSNLTGLSKTSPPPHTPTATPTPYPFPVRG